MCRFAGYDTGACNQPAAVVYTLKLLIGVAPVAFIVTGLMILLLYPISEDVRLRNKVCLDELRSVLLMDDILKRNNPPILHRKLFVIHPVLKANIQVEKKNYISSLLFSKVNFYDHSCLQPL